MQYVQLAIVDVWWWVMSHAILSYNLYHLQKRTEGLQYIVHLKKVVVILNFFSFAWYLTHFLSNQNQFELKKNLKSRPILIFFLIRPIQNFNSNSPKWGHYYFQTLLIGQKINYYLFEYMSQIMFNWRQSYSKSRLKLPGAQIEPLS